MGFLNKFFKKADKSQKKTSSFAKATEDKKERSQVKVEKKKELTVAELKEKKFISTSTVKGEGKKKSPAKEKAVIPAKGESHAKGEHSASGGKKAIQKDDTKMAYRVLVKPLITEKGTYLASENKYLFEVAKRTNKIEIKKAIFAVYGVWPKSVNTINLKGKKVRHGKTIGKTKDTKKAIITLKQGETIEVYEGV